MPCVDIPLNLPTPPAIFIGPPQFPPAPAFTGDFCCHFSLQPVGVNTAIAALNAGISAAVTAGAAPFLVAMMGINEIIAVGQSALDEIRNQLPECPLESASVSF